MKETMGHSQFFLLPVVLFMVLCYGDSKETNAPFMLMSPQISTRNYSRVKNLWESRQSYNAFWSPSFVLETWILSLTLSIVFLRMAGSFQITVKKYPILSVKNGVLWKMWLVKLYIYIYIYICIYIYMMTSWVLFLQELMVLLYTEVFFTNAWLYY